MKYLLRYMSVSILAVCTIGTLYAYTPTSTQQSIVQNFMSKLSVFRTHENQKTMLIDALTQRKQMHATHIGHEHIVWFLDQLISYMND